MDADTHDWSEAEGRALHAGLLALGRKVAAAESLSVGRVQAELGRWSGASRYFAGGVTAYEIAAKVKLLGVDAGHAKEVNAVSARVAEEMACGVARLFGAQIGVATTGYAEADAARGVAAPFAWVAVAWGREAGDGVGEGGVSAGAVGGAFSTVSLRVEGVGLGREMMQTRSAAAALRVLAERLGAESASRSSGS